MKNKIISFRKDINNLVKKIGGGTPVLKSPESIVGLENLLRDLIAISKLNQNELDEKIVFALYHKNKLNTIPPISRRFTKCLNVIFGITDFDYQTTT
jgi:hypothetical protein